jgi:hypothetical protein
VHRLAATMLAATVLGDEAESIVCLGDNAHLRLSDGTLRCAELDALAE